MRFYYYLILVTLLVACSSNPVKQKKEGLLEDFAESHTSSCSPLSDEDRARILSYADPSNFQKTRYRKGPRYGFRNIEREADCSSFVYEIYRRAGLQYSYQSSRQLQEAPEFERLPESEAKPGDIMVFSGHVGIVSEEGKIISATRVRRKLNRHSAITKLNRENFRGRPYVLRYRCSSSSLAQK